MFNSIPSSTGNGFRSYESPSPQGVEIERFNNRLGEEIIALSKINEAEHSTVLCFQKTVADQVISIDYIPNTGGQGWRMVGGETWEKDKPNDRTSILWQPDGNNEYRAGALVTYRFRVKNIMIDVNTNRDAVIFPTEVKLKDAGHVIDYFKRHAK